MEEGPFDGSFDQIAFIMVISNDKLPPVNENILFEQSDSEVFSI